jgi:hypothetical protein
MLFLKLGYMETSQFRGERDIFVYNYLIANC